MTEGGEPAVARFSAAFLDRDGTLIRDVGYPSDVESVELIPGAAEAVRELNRRGIPVVVVTNQSGIGRGYFGEEAYRAVQREVGRLLERRNARLDLVRHCPHAPDAGCRCRKPRPGMYREAARDLDVDLGGALYAGDRRSDVLPARRTGGTGLLLSTEDAGRGGEPPPGCRAAPNLRAGLRELLATRTEMP